MPRNNRDWANEIDSENIKILIADDHTLVRQLLVTFCALRTKFSVVGEAGNGLEVVKLAAKLNPDLIIMDIVMPEMDGIEAIQEIRKTSRKVKILILSMHSDKETILRTIEVGVDGFILKTAKLDDLLSAIQNVVDGKGYIDNFISQSFLTETKLEKSLNGKLTKRELEIIHLIAEGKTCKQIGKQLYISTFTAQKHRKNILKKLDLHGTAELVKYAFKNKINTHL